MQIRNGAIFYKQLTNFNGKERLCVNARQTVAGLKRISVNAVKFRRQFFAPAWGKRSPNSTFALLLSAAQYRNIQQVYFALQLAAVYLTRLLAAVSHFIVSIGQKKQLIACHYGNHMRNKICMKRYALYLPVTKLEF